METYLHPGCSLASGSCADIQKTSYCVVQTKQTCELLQLIFIGYFNVEGRSEVVLPLHRNWFVNLLDFPPDIHPVTLTYMSLLRQLPIIGSHTITSSRQHNFSFLWNNIIFIIIYYYYYFVEKLTGECPDEKFTGRFNISYNSQDK